MLMKYCNHAGCKNLIPATEKYCEEHRNDPKDRQFEYDSNVRDKESSRFHSSTAWKKKRKEIMLRDCGLDVYELVVNGNMIDAECVHHIIEVKDDIKLALNDDNLISLSNKTHAMVSEVYKRDNERAELQKVLKMALKAYQQLF